MYLILLLSRLKTIESPALSRVRNLEMGAWIASISRKPTTRTSIKVWTMEVVVAEDPFTYPLKSYGYVHVGNV